MNIRQAVVADAAAIARVHVESWRTTYHGIVPDDYLANLSYERRATYWASELNKPDNPHVIFVAEDDQGEVVGFASGGPEREADPVYTGELYAIYLLADRQQAGVGRRLVQAVASHLVEAGFTTMLVWVLAANPSRGFYERLGGRYVRSKFVTMAGVELEEVAYGWTDLTPLGTSP